MGCSTPVVHKESEEEVRQLERPTVRKFGFFSTFLFLHLRLFRFPLYILKKKNFGPVRGFRQRL